MISYNVDRSYFKENGYTFHKLYARNYHCYNKKIGGFSLWCWVKGRVIEVNKIPDIERAIFFFESSVRNGNYKVSNFFKNGHVPYLLNNNTGEYIMIYDAMNRFKGDLSGWFDSDYKNGDKYTEGTFPIPEFNLLINEIKNLTA